MFQRGKSAGEIIEKKGLRQSANSDDLLAVCKRAIEKNERAAQEFKGGKIAAINAIKGFVMRETSGRANPTVVDKILRELLLTQVEQ
jgi:aspartyl-tRNA(Asn)/glutamyl-tRNA(Gln) amidotransferase subunit B